MTVSSARWLPLILLGACRSEEPVRPPAPTPPVVAPAAEVRLTPDRLAISAVMVAELSTNADRPATFSAAIEDVVRDAWKERGALPWAPDRAGADGGFEVRAAYIVQLLDGDEPRPAADEGTLYVAVRAEAERRVRGVTAELYRDEQRREAAWRKGAPVGATVEGLLGDVTRVAKERLEARILVHHVEDAELLRLLREGGAAERSQAAVEAGERRLTAAVPVLIDALGSDDTALLESVAVTLGRLRDERAVRPLARLTSSNDPDVLRAAVHALGDLDSELARRYLGEMAESHAHALVRDLAREMLDREAP